MRSKIARPSATEGNSWYLMNFLYLIEWHQISTLKDFLTLRSYNKRKAHAQKEKSAGGGCRLNAQVKVKIWASQAKEALLSIDNYNYSSCTWSLIHFVATHFSPLITAQLPCIDNCKGSQPMMKSECSHEERNLFKWWMFSTNIMQCQ